MRLDEIAILPSSNCGVQGAGYTAHEKNQNKSLSIQRTYALGITRCLARRLGVAGIIGRPYVVNLQNHFDQLRG